MCREAMWCLPPVIAHLQKYRQNLNWISSSLSYFFPLPSFCNMVRIAVIKRLSPTPSVSYRFRTSSRPMLRTFRAMHRWSHSCLRSRWSSLRVGCVLPTNTFLGRSPSSPASQASITRSTVVKSLSSFCSETDGGKAGVAAACPPPDCGAVTAAAGAGEASSEGAPEVGQRCQVGAGGGKEGGTERAGRKQSNVGSRPSKRALNAATLSSTPLK